MSTGQLDKLIENLAGELEPVKRLRHPLLRIAPWIALTVLYILAVDYFYLEFRPDLSDKTSDPIFIFEISLALAAGLSAAIATAWLCVPDARGQSWIMAVPITLSLTFLSWSFIRGANEGLEPAHMHLNHCFHDGIVLIAIPAAVIMFLSRCGATTRPVLMGIMNAIAVGALGYIGLRLSCQMDNIAHGCFYHIAPFILAGGVVGLLARRIYRW